MPKVPTYESQQQVKPLPTPFMPISGRSGAAAFYSQQAFMHTARVLSQIGEREREKRDRQVINEGVTAYTAASNDIMYSGDAAAMSTQGVNAEDIAQKTLKKLETLSTETLKTANGKRQVEALQLELKNRLNAQHKELQLHEQREYEASYDKGYKSSILSDSNSAVHSAAAGNLVGMSMYIASMGQRTRDYAADKGWSDTERDREIAEITSGTLRASVKRLLDEDRVTEAKELFEDADDVMLAEDVGAIKKLLTPATEEAKVFEVADRITAGLDTPITDAMLSEIDDALEKVDPSIRGPVAQRVAIKVGRQRDIETLEDNQKFNSSWDKVQKHKTTDAISRGEWHDHDADDQARLTREAARLNQPMDRATNYGVLWREWYAKNAKQKLATNPYRELSDYLSDADFKMVIKEWSDLNTTGTEGQKPLYSFEKRLKDYLARNKMKLSDEQMGWMRPYAEEIILQEREDKKVKYLSPERLDEIIDLLMTEGELKRPWYRSDPNVVYGAVPPEDRARFYQDYSEQPDEVTSALRRWHEEVGRPGKQADVGRTFFEGSHGLDPEAALVIEHADLYRDRTLDYIPPAELNEIIGSLQRATWQVNNENIHRLWKLKQQEDARREQIQGMLQRSSGE